MTTSTYPATGRDVLMGEYVVDDDVATLATESLGPCIAIGVRYEGWLALLHQFGPSHGAPEFPLFFERLNALIPEHARCNLRPVVAGGKLDFEHDGEDAVVNAGTVEDRAWVLSEVKRLGYGAPYVCWCLTDAKCQAVRLEKATAIAVVTTEAWDGTLTSMAVSLPPA